MTEIDSAVFYAKEFVDHGLVGPLSEQWSHGVVPSIDDEQYWSGISLSEVEELFLLCHLVSNLCG